MRYAVVSAVDFHTMNSQGEPITLPAGSVVNVIVWDGEAHFDPGPNLTLVQSDTLQIGDPSI